MIAVSGCYEYVQNDVLLLDENNISKGVKVLYKAKSNLLPANVSDTQTL